MVQPRTRAVSRGPRLLVCVAVAWLAGCGPSPTSPTPSPGVVIVSGASPAVTTPADSPAVTGTALGATRFIAFGDSITCGTVSAPLIERYLAQLNCTPSNAYPERLLTLLQATVPAVQRTQVKVWNRGNPAEMAAYPQGEQRLREELAELMALPLGQQPQVLLLLMGVNDMNSGYTAARAASSVAYLAHIARGQNLSVLVATMPQTFPGLAPSGLLRDNSSPKIVAFNEELTRQLTGVPNVWMVDMYGAFGGTAAQRAGLMGIDGLHPTESGLQRMAETFRTEIIFRFPVRSGLQ